MLIVATSATAVEKFLDLGVKMSEVQYKPTTSAIILGKEDTTLVDEVNTILEELRNL